MALTITQYPLSKTPAYNDQWFIGSSNQTAISDFYYKIDFTCNSITLTEKVLPDPNGRFVYNAKEKAKNFIEHYFNPNDVTIVEATNKAVSITLTVTEYYSGSLKTPSSFTYVAFDGCLNEEDFANYLPNTFCNTNLLGLPKQLNPADNIVTPTTDIWVHWFPKTPTGTGTYYVDVSINGSYYDAIAMASYNQNKIYALNLGYQTMLDLGHTLAVGDVITWSFINNTGFDLLLFDYTYTVTNICSKYDVTRLYYLSRNGRILYKQFSLASSKKALKKTSNVRLGKGNVVSGIMVSNRYEREVHEVSNVTTYTNTLISDWISEEQNEALQELFDSPIVWQHDGTNYIPVTITDTSFEFKKHNSDKLFNYTVNIEYNTQETRQRGL
jgi:hypothetical protein